MSRAEKTMVSSSKHPTLSTDKNDISSLTYCPIFKSNFKHKVPQATKPSGYPSLPNSLIFLIDPIFNQTSKNKDLQARKFSGYLRLVNWLTPF